MYHKKTVSWESRTKQEKEQAISIAGELLKSFEPSKKITLPSRITIVQALKYKFNLTNEDICILLNISRKQVRKAFDNGAKAWNLREKEEQYLAIEKAKKILSTNPTEGYNRH